MQVLSLQGDHFQMGLQHGQQVHNLRPLIVAAIDARLAKSAQRSSLDERLLQELEQAWMENARSTTDMLRGIAQGLEMPFSRVFHYAAASYLDDVALSSASAEACTVWAASGSATRDGTPILTKNRDYSFKHVPLQLLAHAAPSEGYQYLYVTSAGSPAVFSSGMNEKGLAVADTHVPSGDVGPGLSRYTLMMMLLEQHSTVTSALACLRKTSCMGAGNLILADALGDLAVVENGYRQCGFISPVDHVVVATNHFVTSELRDQSLGDRAGTPTSESEARRQTVWALLNESRGALDVDAAKKVMAHHNANGRAAICRHQLDDDAGTISNAIFIPAERRLVFCNGRPCEGGYVTRAL